MENTQPPAWKLMKPRPTQLRPQARLGLGPPRIFYRPCLDCSSVSTRPRLLRYSPTATVLTPCSPSPTALRHSLIRFHFSSSRCVPLSHSALQYRYSPCPMGGDQGEKSRYFLRPPPSTLVLGSKLNSPSSLPLSLSSALGTGKPTSSPLPSRPAARSLLRIVQHPPPYRRTSFRPSVPEAHFAPA